MFRKQPHLKDPIPFIETGPIPSTEMEFTCFLNPAMNVRDSRTEVLYLQMKGCHLSRQVGSFRLSKHLNSLKKLRELFLWE